MFGGTGSSTKHIMKCENLISKYFLLIATAFNLICKTRLGCMCYPNLQCQMRAHFKPTKLLELHGSINTSAVACFPLLFNNDLFVRTVFWPRPIRLIRTHLNSSGKLTNQSENYFASYNTKFLHLYDQIDFAIRCYRDNEFARLERP